MIPKHKELILTTTALAIAIFTTQAFAAEKVGRFKGPYKDYLPAYTATEAIHVSSSYYTGETNSYAPARLYGAAIDRIEQQSVNSAKGCNTPYYAIDHLSCSTAAYGSSSLITCDCNVVCLQAKQGAPRKSPKKR